MPVSAAPVFVCLISDDDCGAWSRARSSFVLVDRFVLLANLATSFPGWCFRVDELNDEWTAALRRGGLYLEAASERELIDVLWQVEEGTVDAALELGLPPGSLSLAGFNAAA